MYVFSFQLTRYEHGAISTVSPIMTITTEHRTLNTYGHRSNVTVTIIISSAIDVSICILLYINIIHQPMVIISIKISINVNI